MLWCDQDVKYLYVFNVTYLYYFNVYNGLRYTIFVMFYCVYLCSPVEKLSVLFPVMFIKSKFIFQQLQMMTML